MAGARDVNEMDTWKLADALNAEVNRLIDLRPIRFRPKLIEQILDASESAVSNLAEGFSRYYPREHAHFVRVAKGSLAEVITRLPTAVRRRLFTTGEIATALSLARRSHGACTELIRYLETAEAPGSPPRASKPRKNARARNRELRRRSPGPSTSNSEPGPSNPEPRTSEPRTSEPGTLEPGTLKPPD